MEGAASFATTGAPPENYRPDYLGAPPASVGIRGATGPVSIIGSLDGQNTLVRTSQRPRKGRAARSTSLPTGPSGSTSNQSYDNSLQYQGTAVAGPSMTGGGRENDTLEYPDDTLDVADMDVQADVEDVDEGNGTGQGHHTSEQYDDHRRGRSTSVGGGMFEFEREESEGEGDEGDESLDELGNVEV